MLEHLPQRAGSSTTKLLLDSEWANMSNPFDSLSKTSLDDALLNRLNQLANLKHESREYRRKLSEIRSELHRVEYELTQIQSVINAREVIPFHKVLDIAVNPVRESQRKVG